ncbi:FtsX-like permease family protein [Steroidobacter sp.]|uniref:FtsX-like permease family protein n=1 Tax=Steroidobacter sp. TaxID=1978227 RepID=UPI001A41F2BA|nr:FtsX-like permease family protein [Steroidobacter sp.]MBL8269777.1 FtsX-like permease family protein [Steroidobacter sp.]
MISSLLIEAAISGPMRRSPGRTLLAVLAIALGVALGLAIYLINRSAADEISLAARSLYGLADLAVEGGSEGFDENLYPQIARVPGVSVASPVVEVEAKLIGRRGALTLMGLDGFRSRLLQPAFAQAVVGGDSRSGDDEESNEFDNRSILLSASAARELQLDRGDFIEFQVGVQREKLRVTGVLPPAALQDFAGVVDIATAQWLFGRLGKLSRLNLRLLTGSSPEQVKAALAQILPPGVKVTTPGEATDDALRLSRAYRSNLTALALVALFTGGFFVYSTQSLAALRRRREFAVMHAIGVTRTEQLLLMLSGSVIVGVLGAAIGIVLGLTIARIGLTALGADLGAGYFRGFAPGLNVHIAEIAVFSLLGIGVAMAGALRPALDAARVPTASALKVGDVTSGEIRSHGWTVFTLAALAGTCVFLPSIDGLPLPGFVAIALLLIACVVAMPSVVRFVLSHAPRFRALPYEIAVAQIAGTARYATLSVSAIIVSFSLMASMAIMVTSFRDSLDQWTQKVLPADLYVRVGYVGQSSYLEESLAQSMARLPGVNRVEYSRFTRVQLSADRPAATLVARTLNRDRPDEVLWMMSSATGPVPVGALPLWINEAAADLFGLAPGDALEFELSGKPVVGSVRGVWRDYEHQNGAVVMDRNDYVALTGDRAVNSVWFWLDGSADVAKVGSAVRDAMPPGTEHDLRTPGEIRQLSLAAFDRTFAITYLLELVAVTIGLFGIAAGISAQVLARRSEFGALRHLGFTRKQVATMLAIEGSVLGALGVIVGLLAGAAISLILIYVVNRQSFHWSMDLRAPVGLLTGLSVALIAAAALIAVISGRQAMGGEVVRAVREDW